MPRPRIFDKDDVLERAMMLFWSRGYEATSIRDLKAATGISTSSMYEAFGDKRGVFLAALARFCTYEQQRIFQMASDSGSPTEFVEILFASIDHIAQPDAVAQGSLAFNAMVEFGMRDSDVTRQLLDHYFAIADVIADVFAQAQAAGDMPSMVPSAHLAHTVLSALQGVATVTGVQPDYAYRDAVKNAMLLLISGSFSK